MALQFFHTYRPVVTAVDRHFCCFLLSRCCQAGLELVTSSDLSTSLPKWYPPLCSAEGAILMFAKAFTEGLCLRCSDVRMLYLGVCIGAHTLFCPRVQWWRCAYFSLVGNCGRHIVGKRQLSPYLNKDPEIPDPPNLSLSTSPRTEDL